MIFLSCGFFLGEEQGQKEKNVFFSDPLLVKNKLYIMLFKRTVYRSTLQ